MSTAAQRYSVDDYLAIERASQTKHEYFDGEIFAMAGGTDSHNLVGANLTRELGNELKGTGCRVYSGDMRVLCPTGLYTYPDVSVACAAPQFEDDTRDSLLNPILVVEVLSKSTEKYDRGRKLVNYQSIGSLKTVLLVSQKSPIVELIERRPDGSWASSQIEGLDATVKLTHPKCELPMAEVYANVEFND